MLKRRPLRFGALVLAYRQVAYLSWCLRALAPHVDHVVVLHSETPFSAYNPKAPSEFGGPDGSRQVLDDLTERLSNLHVIDGVWEAEEPMRDAGLAELRRLGCGVCLIVDADELWPEGGLASLKEEISARRHKGAVFLARHRTCFKRLDYVVEAPQRRLPVAVHLDRSTRFVDRRFPSGPRLDLDPSLHFWHLGYVLDDARMWEKIRTFSHAHEVVKDWYQEKWLGWTPTTRDLGRRDPSRWPSTRRIDPRRLPAILHDHPWFLEMKPDTTRQRVR